MQQSSYGVLKCRILETSQIKGDTPHFHIHTIGDNTHYRVAINIQSEVYPYDVLYYIDYNFQNELTARLSEFPFGFNELGPNIKEDYGLDYLRGKLFSFDKLQPLPGECPGPDNDLNEKIRELTHKALQNQKSILYAFGKRWGPDGNKDKYFHFTPSEGVHFVHMNQGKSAVQENEHNSWEDGGLLFHFLPENRWNAVFLAFQSHPIQSLQNEK